MPENLGDIPRAEAFKRLGRRLHPHIFSFAAPAFAVALGAPYSSPGFAFLSGRNAMTSGRAR
ncbi:hypothetical protein [Micromonospora sp. NPDC001898]|uniref:hypothetical protein n=1 Tax=Micromonospora sp. NPDC001898 TaxID=3364221 RepID=UPI0036C7B5FF